MRDYREVNQQRYEQEALSSQVSLEQTKMHGYIFPKLVAVTQKCATYLSKNAQILDFGCGVGENLTIWKTLGYDESQLHGIDFSINRVKHAKKRYPNMDFEQGNILEYSENKRHHFISTFDVFSHFSQDEDIRKGLENIHTALTDDGIFLWYDIHSTDHFAAPQGVDSWGFSRAQFKNYLSSAGFEIVEEGQCFKLWFNRISSLKLLSLTTPTIARWAEILIPGKPLNCYYICRKIQA